MIRRLRSLLHAYQDYRSIDITDPYIEWLRYANVGMLTKGNLYCFDYAIRNLTSDAPIVEIGPFCGLSTNAIAYYKRKHGRKNRFINCDRWEFGPFVASDTLCERPVHEMEAFIRDNYIRNIEMFSRDDLPYTIELGSDDFFAAWGKGETRVDMLGREIGLGGQISFAYIDGDHSYAAARRDFENVDRFLEPGGFILFDDSSDYANWESRKVAQEAKPELFPA